MFIVRRTGQAPYRRRPVNSLLDGHENQPYAEIISTRWSLVRLRYGRYRVTSESLCEGFLWAQRSVHSGRPRVPFRSRVALRGWPVVSQNGLEGRAVLALLARATCGCHPWSMVASWKRGRLCHSVARGGHACHLTGCSTRTRSGSSPVNFDVMPRSQPDLIGEVCAALRKAAVDHGCYHDCVHVALPKSFGTLEVKVWPDGEDSIQLLDGDFHTHLDLLAQEYSCAPVEAFVRLVQDILRGKLLLIEESADGVTRRTIEESLEAYTRYLPSNSTYRVVNEA